MRLARAILSLSTMIIALVGVSAFSADPPENSSAELAVPVATNGDHCPGADVGLDVDTTLGSEAAPEAEAILAALDDSCVDADAAVEGGTRVACDQPMYGGPPPSPDPKKLWCADVWDGDCFAGCCGPRGRVQKWAECCRAAGGPCQTECQTTCMQKWCNPGPN